jgi:F0F1-type ATP synthase assembly protein I
MTDPPLPRNGSPRPTNRGMVAGSLLVATLLICAAVGLGLGALLGASVVGLFVGIFAGFPLGVVVVKKRFEDV